MFQGFEVKGECGIEKRFVQLYLGEDGEVGEEIGWKGVDFRDFCFRRVKEFVFDLRVEGSQCRILSSSVKIILVGLQKSQEESRIGMDKIIQINVINQVRKKMVERNLWF